MSSTNVSAILSAISVMESQLAALKAQLGAKSEAPSVPVKEKKPRKKSDAPPSAWRLFTDRVRELLRGNGYEKAALGVECVQFCASLKDENSDFASWSDPDILARRADWSPPAVSRGEAKFGPGWAKTGERRAAAKAASAANSVVSDGEAAPAEGSAEEKPKKARKNPWEGLSPEDRAAKIAAMKAGRAAKKAAAEESPDGDDAPAVVESAAVVTDTLSDAGSSSKKTRKPWSEETKAAAAAKRAAKKAAASGTTSASAVPLPPSPPASVTGATEFQGIMLGGVRYLVNLENGYCFRRETDGSQGDWAGIFHRTGGPKNNGPYIDDSVPEPEDGELVFEE